MRTMLSMPLAYPSTLDRASCWLQPAGVVLRGGALEPEHRPLLRKRQAKANVIQRLFNPAAPRVFLSQAGPRFDLELAHLGHHLRFRVEWRKVGETKKDDPWVALAQSRRRTVASACAPLRGQLSIPSGRWRRPCTGTPADGRPWPLGNGVNGCRRV